jgi:hypothetical protein
MATAGTSLIWSPRSNISLYGDTARVTTAHRLGVRIALGTDWMPSGSMNLLRELSCADSFNATYLDHYFRDDQLWKMVTVNAAGLTATEDVIGSLAPGKIADISIFASHGKPPFRSVIEAEPKDVALVMRGGKVLYGDDAAIAALTAVAARTDSCDTVDVCGTAKRVCVMGEVKKTYDALKTAANIYPAFACGVPDNEPVCAPSRPVSVASSTVYTGMTSDTDSDGDGIPDAMDNCPKVFNPIRPLDEGKQGDADGDGVGDACDPCPLDANSTACTPIATGDRDHDGVPDISDNCPEIANPDQADDDKDGKGNACDACPADANPGSAGCPASIYQIKKGQVPVGSAVRVTNALVTGLGTNGFFVQVKETDTGVYDGSDYSGMFVFTSVNPHSDPKYVGVIPGARVNIDGAVDNFHGELELDNLVQVQVVSTGLEDPPAPVAAAYADVNTGGARLASLEGVIVSLGAAVPTAINATSGEIALTYAAGQAISLDHFVFAVPAPVIGQSYTAVTGILALRQPVPAAPASIAKIEPRSAADLPLGPPVIALFGPALSSARVGTTINLPTFPDPLTVTLSSPATEATTIALTSSDTNALAVSDLVIPKDGTTGTVLVTALAPSADVTITGTLNGQTVTAHVQVLSEIAVPSKVTLSPATSSIAPNGSVQLTATLDLPATESTPITLDVAPLLAGTLPATVNIDAGQTTVTFTYTDSSAASAQITATFLASTSTATVNVTSGPNHLVISQVYGGGQGTATTTPFASDFVELHNPTSTPLSLAGLSIQYASATNANGAWSGLTILPALTVLPGGYVLVGEATGTVGAQVPTPDVIGTIAVSATAAKVALVSGITTLANGCPATGIIDHVAYGVSTVTCFEGSGPVPASPTPMSAATSAKRLLDGCRDTDDNATDFAVAAATAPRNSASAPVPCQ